MEVKLTMERADDEFGPGMVIKIDGKNLMFFRLLKDDTTQIDFDDLAGYDPNDLIIDLMSLYNGGKLI